MKKGTVLFLALWLAAGAAWAAKDDGLGQLTAATQDLLQATGSAGEAGAVISLVPGEVQSIRVDEIQRVVIGDPNIADVEVVSSKELFLQAKTPGTTNLLLWDKQGQRTSNVEVIDRLPEAIAAQLRELLDQLNLPNVSVHRDEQKLFLTGIVSSQEDLDRVEQMLTAFSGQVTNLVALQPGPPPPPPPPPPSVKLTVQVLELTREASDELGVDWADSLTFTETTFGAAGPSGVSIPARLGEAFRFGALTRTGFNPVLNLLLSSGKGRLLAEPKLVAASGKEATTFLGVEKPIITTTTVSDGAVTQSIEFKNVGVELGFKPTVLDGGEDIQVIIRARVSSIDNTVGITVSGILVPGFRTRQTETELVTKHGASVFISGLLQDEESKNLSQLPGLGSIPVLGNLFKSTEFTHDQSELVVVVTPEILGEREAAAEERGAMLEQALSSAEVVSSVEDPSLRYALQVQERIARAIRYPLRESHQELSGRVKVRLHLFRDGTLGQATVSESSGTGAFDAEALKAAETQAPYPPFPPGLVQPDLWLEVPVLFRP